jgi:hypothetical protein
MEQLFKHLINLEALRAVDDVRYGWIRKYRHIRNMFMEVKWFIQRGKRGYADCDIWGFDTYLARVISEGCKQLKDSAHSAPTRLSGHLAATQSDIAIKRWSRILEKISRGFILLNMWEDNGRMPTDAEKREIAKGWFLFKKYFSDLWD